jgi:hypothetical protein
MCLIWIWGAVFEVAVSLNHDVMTSCWLHKWPRTPKSEPSSVDNCLRTLYVLYGRWKQFVVAVSLNHDEMISFWLHKCPITPQTETISVDITILGYYHMPMDSISMCSNTLYMSNMDMGIIVWGSCQPQPWRYDIILTPQVTQNPANWNN